MNEEHLKDVKSWGIEDAIKHLKICVDVLNAEIKQAETSLDVLKDRRNSLGIGRYILEKIQEERSQRPAATANKEES